VLGSPRAKRALPFLQALAHELRLIKVPLWALIKAELLFRAPFLFAARGNRCLAARARDGICLTRYIRDFASLGRGTECARQPTVPPPCMVDQKS
jgi:hypothetical protein